MQDNVYGTLEQDAWRRDFTINALYYNIQDFSIVDYTGGMADLQAGEITLIGDPETRYREDPVRMLRALRFVAKLGLSLSKKTEEAIGHCAALLRDIPPARLFDETLKLYLTGNAQAVHQLLVEYGLFAHMYPYTADCLKEAGGEQAAKLIERALHNTDARIKQDKPVTPAFLFAALLWPPQQKRQQLLMSHGMPEMPALQRAAAEVLSEQVQSVAVPKRFTLVTRDIWTLQARLSRRQGKRAYVCLGHPKFRAGYDFLLLRNESGEPLEELAQWWTEFQTASSAEQDSMISNLSSQGPKRPRRRRRRRSNAKKTQEA
jgi:poly(A) polymerase